MPSKSFLRLVLAHLSNNINMCLSNFKVSVTDLVCMKLVFAGSPKELMFLYNERGQAHLGSQ